MELYKNKKWLEKKYLKEKLSMYRIGQICGTNDVTVFNWLKKYNIPTRSYSESTHLARANHCDLSSKAIEWINGELLGDGSLFSDSPYSAMFTYGSKHLEYINYINDILQSFGIKRAGKIKKYHYETRGNYDSYTYCSLAYVELLSIYKKWYFNGKRIISKDLKLTPLICRQHYLGDGSLIHPENGKPNIILATCRYSVSDVEWLAKQLTNLGFKSARQPANNTIRISVYSIKNFLDYIGSSPVRCYRYKFAY